MTDGAIKLQHKLSAFNEYCQSKRSGRTLWQGAPHLLSGDQPLTIHVADASVCIAGHAHERYDFIFADTWPGKFTDLEETLGLLSPGGLYFIDDLLPQPNWPEGHQVNVDALTQTLLARADLHCTFLNCASGLMICTRLT